MLTGGLMKHLERVHWQRCGWYFDCPLYKPPDFDIPLPDSLQSSLIGTWTLEQKPDNSTLQARVQHEGVKLNKAPKPEADPAKEDIPILFDRFHHPKPTTTLNMPPLDVVSTPTITPREPTFQCQKAAVPKSPSTAVFITPPKHGSMMRKPGLPTSNYTSLDFIFNNSFVRLADEKKKTGKIDSQFDEILAFLARVLYYISMLH